MRPFLATPTSSVSPAAVSTASAPGYTTYYLWFLASNHRVQAVVDDPDVGWVGRTVSMLRELGH